MQKSQLAMVTMAGLFSSTLYITQAQAECNSELPYDQLIDCIVVEGSGAEYNTTQKTTSKENDVSETVTEIKQQKQTGDKVIASAD